MRTVGCLDAVWPVLERVVDELKDALIPRVRDEELARQAARLQVLNQRVAQAGEQ